MSICNMLIPARTTGYNLVKDMFRTSLVQPADTKIVIALVCRYLVPIRKALGRLRVTEHERSKEGGGVYRALKMTSTYKLNVCSVCRADNETAVSTRFE